MAHWVEDAGSRGLRVRWAGPRPASEQVRPGGRAHIGRWERRAIKYLWAVVYLSVLIWSGFDPRDRFTWFLEVLPAVIGGVVLVATYGRFRLTPVLYFFVLLHCLVLMVGGHYTYAEVPLFDNLFGAERNNYDKVGHFFQGFVPALLAREILIRNDVVRGTAWRNLFVVSVCLAFSAFYELIEWWVALCGTRSRTWASPCSAR